MLLVSPDSVTTFADEVKQPLFLDGWADSENVETLGLANMQLEYGSPL